MLTSTQLYERARKHAHEAFNYELTARRARRDDGDSRYAEELEACARMHRDFEAEDEALADERALREEGLVAS